MAHGELPPIVQHGATADHQLICGFLGCDLLPYNPALTSLPQTVAVRKAGESDSLLHAAPERQWSLADLCKHVGISRSQLS